jgi:hypothetical protein
MSAFEARVARAEDNPALQTLFGIPQPSSGLHMAFERAPDYFASAAVMYHRPELLIVTRRQDNTLAAAVNMGMRRMYLNGSAQDLRYGADMRISPDFQGGRVLLYVNRAVKDVVRDGWYLSVILEENGRSRGSLEGGRAGLPDYRAIGSITTYTVTAQRHSGQGFLPLVRTATAADIPAMNRFVARMADHYQFLSCYDFNGLLTGDPFFQGLTLGDFLLVGEGDDLRGLVGVWNQKAFKQTRVIRYSRSLHWLRPLWNLWASWTGGMHLPPAGQSFDYLALHSPLTRPDDLPVFSALLQAAWAETRRRGSRAMTLTLADTDPRRDALKQFRYLPLRARQYTVAFDDAAQPVLAGDRIPFYESGRL